MKGILLTMVSILVFAISLTATPIQGNTGVNYPRISIIEQEEVVDQDVSAPIYEILAIKPVKRKQSWLPSYTYNSNKTNNKNETGQRIAQRNGINRVHRRKTGRH